MSLESVMRESVVKVDEASSEEKAITPPEEKKEEGESTGEPVASGEPTETKQEESTDSSKKKDRTYHGKINQLTARAHTAEAKILAIQKASEARIAELESKLANSNKSSDDDDDDEDTGKLNLTSEAIKELVDAAVEDRIAKAKEGVMKTEYETLSAEVQTKVGEFYKDRYNDEVGSLDDEAQEEVDLLASVFKSNPKYWRDRVVKDGVEVVVASLTGKAPAKRISAEEALKKKDAIDINTSSKSKGSDDGEQKPKGLRNIIQDALKKTKT